MSHPTAASAASMRDHLELLLMERALAEMEGLASDGPYAADLEEEINETHSAYVGAAVTEIASLRAQLSGPLEG